MTEENVPEFEAEEVFGEPEYGVVKVFFHTAEPMDVPLSEDETLTSLRRKLDTDYGQQTFGLAAILQGQTIVADYEAETYLEAGNSVVFSGSVKGG